MKYLLTGLGNIGAEYRDTRHNIGFMVLDRLAQRFEASFQTGRYATTATVKHKGRQLLLIKPTTYMNLSGKAVRHHLQENKIEVSNLLVITDDLALPFGRMRLRAGGSAGGHNGLKDIETVLGSREYPRLRFGVGDDFSRGKQVDYVLSSFSEQEQAELPDLMDTCVEGILSVVTIGMDRSMSQINRKA